MEIHVWALASALGAAALTATLKAVEYRHGLKLANDVISGLRKEMDMLKQDTNKRISDLEQFQLAGTEKLTNRIHHLESLSKKQSLDKSMPTAPSGQQSWMAR